MRYLQLLIYMVLSSVCLANHITVTSYGDAGGTQSRAKVSRTWYDGLGRPVMTVDSAAGGDGMNVLTFTEYDKRGNKWREWLPVSSSEGFGGVVSNAEYGDFASTLYGSGEKPYTEYLYNEYESNSVSEVRGPGNKWQGHQVRYEHLSNDSLGAYSCEKLYPLDEGGLESDGYYRAGTLQINKQTNPDGDVVLEFTDRKGRVLQKRRISPDGRESADTRWIYDIYGNLRYVISPEGMLAISGGDLSAETLGKYSTSYRYDYQHRVIEIAIPGCEPTEYVYDRLNHPFMSRNGDDRKNGVWRVRKYDRYSRPILEGFTESRLGRAELQKIYGDSLVTETLVPEESIAESQLMYTNSSGLSNFKAFRAWYYDDYRFLLDRFTGAELPAEAKNLSANGLCTGTAFTDSNMLDVWFSVTVYDYRRLPVWECTYDLYLNSRRHTERYEYDFSGNVVHKREIVEDLAERTVIDRRQADWTYTYDRADRLIESKVSVNGGAYETVVKESYDPIGRLSTHTAGVTTSYGYDVRSNITSLVSPKYTETLYYAENPFDSGSVTYNGSVCASSQSICDEEQILRHNFIYRYDWLDRLVSAKSQDGALSEEYEYDLNANVLRLERKYGGVSIQNSVIGLDGNRAVSVYDVSEMLYYGNIPSYPSGDYIREYDSDGRLVSDGTRGIASITYHRWGNLPRIFKLSNGNSSISEYMSDGRLKSRSFTTKKLYTVTKIDPVTKDTVKTEILRPYTENHEYVGNFERIGSKWRLHTLSGYYDLSEGKLYHYVKDRLGSVVAVVDNDGHTQQLTAYYPSGIPYDVFGFGKVTDRLHIGNRWMSLGMNTYDNTARFHYPLIPSFDTPDPCLDKYPDLSPYSHCAGNPLRYVDRNGMELHFLGTDSKDAISELKKKTNLRLKLSSDGAVTYKGNPKNDIDKKLIEIISSTAVDVNVNFTTDRNVTGGSFDGNIKEGDVVRTQQRAHLDRLRQMDSWYRMPEGTSLFHEILESYIGGVDTPNAPPVSGHTDSSGNYEATSVEYLNAHGKASKFDSKFIEPIIEKTVDKNTDTEIINMIKKVSGKTKTYELRKELK